MDIDEVYKDIGEFGPFQQKIFWSLSLMQIFCAFHNIHNVYIGAEPSFKCIHGDKILNSCLKNNVPCDRYAFPGDDFSSIVSEWNLICDQGYKADLVQSFYMAGFLIGSFLFGFIADSYGRRCVLYSTAFGVSLMTILSVMAPSYTVYVTLRCVTGMLSAGFGMVSFTYTSEVIGQSKRGFMAITFPVMFAVGIAMYSLIAWFFRDWRYLALVTATPGVVGFYFYCSVPESPRWLFSQGRVPEAETVLETIALKNRGHAPNKAVQLRESSAEDVGHTKQKQPGIMAAFKHPELRRRTLNNMYTWFVNCCVYYGLTIGAGNLGSDMYISVALSGLIEIPAYFATWLFLDRIGRRPSFTWTMMVAAVVCMSIMALPDGYPNIRTALALCGKIGISVSFCIAWVYAAEMYPTNIRNKAMSVCNMTARLGGIFSPLILAVGRSHPSLDFLVFGAMTFLAALVSMRLPETANVPMPETIDDLDRPRSSERETILGAAITEDKLKLLEGEIGALEYEDAEVHT
ncbi:hypothetical protein CAPTEDRAFT_127727 [Capitella teleta]|uniref:Major facilitator superfamily (MFS) profile domain-containing protein n=1 Tax=Capitella teleta TaxID=283909 RepID=R7UX47_CAPTE|nr:hypothetical protein CAPTEDRAFT_127727 [Capitella teleta]|eukprot:ELU07976.1 hypothetical protein CAPTEDRAFT_127727 [Capitella teleta]